jgi:hypothetical protein
MLSSTRGSTARDAGLVGAALGGVFAYYAWLWGDIETFGHALDNFDFFADFIRHFYPMGRRILDFPYPVSGFYYSAFFALLLNPVGELKLPAAMWVWGAVQVIGTAALAAIPVRRWLQITGWRLAAYALLCATSIPVLHNFKWGQVSVLVTLTVLASWRAHESRRDVAAAVWLALGVAIKYYAAWFILFYLIRRQWRVVAVFAAAVVGWLVIVPSIFIGPVTTYQFHQEAAENLAIAAKIFVQDYNSQFFAHVVLRWLRVVDAPQAVLALSIVGGGLALWMIAAVWQLRHTSSPRAAALSMAALFLALPFLLSTSWPHYFIYLPFCQALVVVGVVGLERGITRTLLLSSVTVSVALASVFAFQAFANWTAYVRPGPLFFADALLIPAVAVLARVEARRSTNAAGA